MKLKLLIPAFMIFLTAGCSIKYGETPVVEDKVPEFVFNDASMVRYENNKLMVEVEAESLEQYRNTSETYGKNVKFTAYNEDDGKVDTKGSCDYLFADADRELYQLFDNIQLVNYGEEMKVSANVLKWDGKTEQLTGSRGDSVIVEKEDTKIKGTGFSASGVSKSFSFRGNVNGNIETE